MSQIGENNYPPKTFDLALAACLQSLSCWMQKLFPSFNCLKTSTRFSSLTLAPSIIFINPEEIKSNLRKAIIKFFIQQILPADMWISAATPELPLICGLQLCQTVSLFGWWTELHAWKSSEFGRLFDNQTLLWTSPQISGGKEVPTNPCHNFQRFIWKKGCKCEVPQFYVGLSCKISIH